MNFTTTSDVRPDDVINTNEWASELMKTKTNAGCPFFIQKRTNHKDYVKAYINRNRTQSSISYNIIKNDAGVIKCIPQKKEIFLLRDVKRYWPDISESVSYGSYKIPALKNIPFNTGYDYNSDISTSGSNTNLSTDSSSQTSNSEENCSNDTFQKTGLLKNKKYEIYLNKFTNNKANNELNNISGIETVDLLNIRDNNDNVSSNENNVTPFNIDNESSDDYDIFNTRLNRKRRINVLDDTSNDSSQYPVSTSFSEIVDNSNDTSQYPVSSEIIDNSVRLKSNKKRYNFIDDIAICSNSDSESSSFISTKSDKDFIDDEMSDDSVCSFHMESLI